MKVFLVILALASVPACGSRSPARVEHNQGLALMAAGKFEEAEKKLLAARDQAGGDDELRRRAAYHLGLAHARHAESLGEDEAERAIDLYRQAASWLRDALRLDPEDGEARQNLEVVLRRIQVLADKLGRDQGKLEARLDRLVEDQRGVLTSVRALLDEIARAGASSDPVGFRAEFDQIATAERQLAAEAGAIADLATDEQAGIRAQPEDQRSPEQRGRLVALEALTSYLDAGRQTASEVRLALRRLKGQVAHARGDAALAQWKRAREQLLDPVSVLQRVATDHREVTVGSGILASLRAGKLSLEGAPAGPPPWLTAEILAQGERDAADRAAEVRARLEALSQAPAQAQGQPGQPAQADPAVQRLQGAAREALPHLDRGLAALKSAGDSLAADDLSGAQPKQVEAESALLEAIERFAGLRQLIELAHAQQSVLVPLLDPDNAEAAKLAAAERKRLVTDGTTRNLERVKRLTGLLADEKARAEAELQAQGGQAQPGAAPDPSAQEAAAAQAELFARAEQARAGAQAALEKLAAAAGGSGGKAKANAEEALRQLDELRRLFFTLIERLKELRQQQGDTHDRSASVQAALDEERTARLPPLADSQTEHTAVAQALAEGLAAQADAAQQSDDPKAAQAAEAMSKATEEVRAAHTQMSEATRVLGEARDTMATQSTDLSPALTAQAEALDHLDEAIRLLEPPRPDDKDKDQEQKDQQDQKDGEKKQDQPQPSPEDKVSAQQAERRLQSIRDREAARRRERERRQQSRPEPVDKDW